MSTSKMATTPLPRGGRESSLLGDVSPTVPLDGRPPLARSTIDVVALGLPIVPGYEMVRVLGSGGMSTVYLARQQKLKRLVAIKMIRREDWNDPELRQRFRREAESIAALEHPNVVQIHEVGETNGVPYIALEFVAGGTLANRINGRPLPSKTAARIALQLADAVQAAHDQQIIHRDLKPANILLAPAKPQQSNQATAIPNLEGDDSNAEDSETERLLAKISDFGLARFLTDDNRQTRSGYAIGTPSYMAPEQTSGRPESIGTPADIYGLGTVLYEMLTGRPPFDGESVIQTVMMVRRDQPVAPSQINPHVPRDLETICLKCLEKEPKHRFASAAELSRDLKRYLTGRPVKARPVGSLIRLTKWARRRPTVAVSITLGALLLIGLVVAFIVLSRMNARLKQSGQQLSAQNDELRSLNQKQEESELALRARLAEMNTQGRVEFARQNPGNCWAQVLAYDALTAEGRHAEARPFIDRARDLSDGPRHGMQGPSSKGMADAAAIKERWSDHCLRLNDLNGAWTALDEALKMRVDLVKQVPNDRSLVIEFGGSLFKMAILHTRMSNLQDDLRATERLNDRLALLEGVSEGADRSQGLIETHDLLAELFRRMRDYPSADKHTGIANDLNQRLLQGRGKRFVLPKQGGPPLKK